MTELKPMPEHVIIQVPAEAWNDLVADIALLKKHVMADRRAVLIDELCKIEDSFGLPRTKEKRVR